LLHHGHAVLAAGTGGREGLEGLLGLGEAGFGEAGELQFEEVRGGDAGVEVGVLVAEGGDFGGGVGVGVVVEFGLEGVSAQLLLQDGCLLDVAVYVVLVQSLQETSRIALPESLAASQMRYKSDSLHLLPEHLFPRLKYLPLFSFQNILAFSHYFFESKVHFFFSGFPIQLRVGKCEIFLPLLLGVIIVDLVCLHPRCFGVVGLFSLRFAYIFGHFCLFLVYSLLNYFLHKSLFLLGVVLVFTVHWVDSSVGDGLPTCLGMYFFSPRSFRSLIQHYPLHLSLLLFHAPLVHPHPLSPPLPPLPPLSSLSPFPPLPLLPALLLLLIAKYISAHGAYEFDLLPFCLMPAGRGRDCGEGEEVVNAGRIGVGA
jgi:hypothetical protein